ARAASERLSEFRASPEFRRLVLTPRSRQAFMLKALFNQSPQQSRAKHRDRKKRESGDLMMRWGQILRIAFGLGLLLTAGAIYLPNLVGMQSTEAVVNARAIAIMSPIEGVAVGNPPEAGRVLHSGDFVAEIRNDTVDQTFLTQLRSEAET